MRSLSATLTTSQKSGNIKPLCKVILSSGATRYGYNQTRIRKLKRHEEPFSQKADILLNNADFALNNLALQGYMAEVSRGIHTGITPATWAPGTAYALEDVVIPTTPNGYQYKCRVAGTSASTGIDAGSDAIDRAGADVTNGFTQIDTHNPANASGIIHTIEIWANTNLTGAKVGIFYNSGGGDFTCRSSASIGNVTAGSKQTFAGLSLAIESGDFMGIYRATGNIDGDNGTLPKYSVSGDAVTNGLTSTFTTSNNRTLSVYLLGVILPTFPTALGERVADNTATWEMDGASGDEYDRAAPYWVWGMNSGASQSGVNAPLELIGIPDRMTKDEASADYLPTSTDTDTVKTLLRKIAGDTGVTFLAAFNHCKAYNMVFDSEDALIDAHIPKDTFRVYRGSSRLAAFRRLLDKTGCVAVFKNDGKIHIKTPTVSGTSYDYSYALGAGNHQFWAKSYRRRIPTYTKITVNTPKDDTPAYTGSATDASHDPTNGIGAEHFVDAKATSNANAAAIATAVLLKYQLQAEGGSCAAIINLGAEVYDWTLVTDARENSTARTGNIGYFEESIDWEAKDPSKIWGFTFGFGKWASTNDLLKQLEVGGVGDEGSLLSKLAVKDLYAENIHATSIVLTEIDQDDIGDGTTYKRVLATSISAGKILLSEATGSLDNIADGSTYSKVLTTDISAGHILLSSVTQSASYRTASDTEKGVWNGKPDDIDELGDGSTYKKVLATQISAGKILLSNAIATPSGKWYDIAGVSIDATNGIILYGSATAFRTRATYGGADQCYMGSDGAIYAGAGAVKLSAGGIYIDGQFLTILESGTTIGYLLGSGSALNLAAASGKGIGIMQSASYSGDAIQITSASNKNVDIQAQGTGRITLTYLKATPSDVTSSRAKDTAYQNTTGYALLVTITVSLAATSSARLDIGSTSGLGNAIGTFSYLDAVSQVVTLTGIVPVGWYYQLTTGSGTITKGNWFETPIGG